MLGFGKKKNKAGTPDEAEATAPEAENPVEQDDAAAPPASTAGTDATDSARAETTAETGTGAEAEPAETPDRSEKGPFDVSEIEDPDAYIDLGSLLIPQVEGVSLRLDVDQNQQNVVSVTLQKEDAHVQVQAFAAPKSRGLWPEIRTELAASVRSQNGMVDITKGSLGRQVSAKIPASLPNGQRGFRVARFVGIDGPRWFLRGVFTGDAAIRPESAAEMEELFRSIVVVRGWEPMAPRDLLPLRVPENAVRREDAEAAQNDDGLQVPERGPEVTQIG